MTEGWKKVTKAGPGQYWCGGYHESPSDHPWSINFDQEYVFGEEGKRWMYYIGPPLEKPPKYVEPPKDGDPVMVRAAADSNWLRAYSAGMHGDGCSIYVYAGRRDKWLSGNLVETWPEWRKPEPHEYP